MQFINIVRADVKKLKSTLILGLHIIVPLLGIGVFVGYFSISGLDIVAKQKLYLTVICIVFPSIVGVITSMIAEEEYLAGNYKNLLSTYKSKWYGIMSKYLILVILGATSIIMTVLGFYFGMSQIDQVLPIKIYWEFSFILIGCSLFLYAFHLFLSLRFSKGVSIGIGVVESLIVALFRTGMGDGRWPYFPCSWSIRFTWIRLLNSANNASVCDPALQLGIILSVVVTVSSIMMLIVWFLNWDGKKNEE